MKNSNTSIIKLDISSHSFEISCSISWNFPNYSLSLPHKKQESMEEKRYPTFDEESSIDRCCEPAVAELAEPLAKSVDGVTNVHDWIDDLDWDRFPSFGPFSEEEAIGRINKFEEELARGEVKWVSSDDAWQRLYEKHQWLR